MERKVKLIVQACDLPWTVEGTYERGIKAVLYLPNGDPGPAPEPSSLELSTINLGLINMDKFFTHEETDDLYNRIVDAALKVLDNGD